MKSGSPLHIRDYVNGLAARGRYSFTSGDARAALDVSADAVKLALNRLAKQGAVASPARGFYVIVPPEYRALGSLPAEQFIPALMERLHLSYYAGLLSAAQFHGAAHHRPQEFQVMLGKSRRPIRCGQVRVAFIVNRRVDETPVQSFNTPRGAILVSTPEATAIDLVGYPEHAGGLDHVAAVLAELAEKIDSAKLAAAAAAVPLPWVQRLGYLLELAEAPEKAKALRDHVRRNAKETTLLLPGASASGERRKDWKLIVNADVEPEL
jgi:predicted transcriptional regulator of viral defense system